VRFNPGGLQVDGSSRNLIEANNASETGGYGIELGGGSFDNDVVRNSANGNGAAGIYVADEALTDDDALTAPGNRLAGNTASGNVADGIVLSKGGHRVTANIARGNGGWGINAALGTIDGGGNVATGNVKPEQCVGVVYARAVLHARNGHGRVRGGRLGRAERSQQEPRGRAQPAGDRPDRRQRPNTRPVRAASGADWVRGGGREAAPVLILLHGGSHPSSARPGGTLDRVGGYLDEPAGHDRSGGERTVSVVRRLRGVDRDGSDQEALLGGQPRLPGARRGRERRRPAGIQQPRAGLDPTAARRHFRLTTGPTSIEHAQRCRRFGR
jgi:parallel beta-helix repeat protein